MTPFQRFVAWLILFLKAVFDGPPKRPAQGVFSVLSTKGSTVQIQYALPPVQTPGNTFEVAITINGTASPVATSPGTPILFTAAVADSLSGTHVEIDVAGGRSPASDAATFVVPPLPDVPPLKPALGVFSVVGP